MGRPQRAGSRSSGSACATARAAASDAEAAGLAVPTAIRPFGLQEIDFTADGRYALASCEFSGLMLKIDNLHVRVAGKDRDTLQSVMALLRGNDFGIDLQFTNYRTN